MTPRFNHNIQNGSGDSVHVSTTLENIALTTLSGYDGEDLREGIKEAKRMNQDAIISALADAFNKPTGIEKQVCNDIAIRQEMGRNKYGTTVAENPEQLRFWLRNLYEEMLDGAIYAKRALIELDNTNPPKP
jgi:hypothetical protein